MNSTYFVLLLCNEIKYLNHYIVNVLSDDKQYAHANIDEVALFRAFCTLLFTAHLQCSGRKDNMQRIPIEWWYKTASYHVSVVPVKCL